MMRWFAVGVVIGMLSWYYMPTGICDSGAVTYATQGACSHHGGVRVWLNGE